MKHYLNSKLARIALTIFVLFAVVGFAYPLLANGAPFFTGISLGNKLVTAGATDPLAIADADFLEGGHMQVPTHGALLGFPSYPGSGIATTTSVVYITPQRRRVGMLVTVLDDTITGTSTSATTIGQHTVTYRLVTNPDNTAGCPSVGTAYHDQSIDGTSLGCNYTQNSNWVVVIPELNSSNTGMVLASDGTGGVTLVTASSTGGGSGTVTSFSSGSLSPLFSTSVSSSTTTPALSFSLSAAGAYTIFGNNSATSSVPSYFTPTLASALFANQGTTSTVLHGNASGNPTWGALSLTTDVSGILPILNGGTNATSTGAAGSIAYSNGSKYAFTSVGTLGQVLSSNGSGTPTWITIATSTAGVTAITAGSGLSGGTITATGTISLDLTHNNAWSGFQSFTGAAPLVSTGSLVSVGNGGFAGGSGSFSGVPQGTQIGVNASSTFIGDLIDLQTNGAAKFRVDAFGNVITSGNLNIGGLAGTAGCLVVDTGGNVATTTCGGGGSVSVGDAIGGATTDQVFYADASGNLAQSGDLNFSDAPGSIFFGAGDYNGTGNGTQIDLEDQTNSIGLYGSPSSSTNALVAVGSSAHAFNGGSGSFSGSSAGTQFAVSADGGFTGNLLDLQTGGTSQFAVDSAGNVTIQSLAGAGGCVSVDTGGLLGVTPCGSGGSVSVGDAIGGANPNGAFYADASGNLAQSDDFGFLEGANPIFGVGDFDATGNGTEFFVDDADQNIALYGSPVVDSTKAFVSIGTSQSSFDGTSGGSFVGNSNGTQLGINADAGFAGNLLDLQTGGASQFSVDAAGDVTVPSLATGSGVYCVTADATGILGEHPCSAGTISIGSPVVGFTKNTVLYVNGSGRLSDTKDFEFAYDGINPDLIVGDVIGSGNTTVLSLNDAEQQIELSGTAQSVKDWGLVNVGDIDGNFGTPFSGSGNGTQLAINATNSFTGNLIDAQDEGSSIFSVDYTGNVAVAGGLFNIYNDGSFDAGSGNFSVDSSGNIFTNARLSAAGGNFSVDPSGDVTTNGTLTIPAFGGSGTNCVTADNSGTFSIAPCGAAVLTAGSPISGIGANLALFTDSFGDLAGSSNFTFTDGSNPEFTVGDLVSAGNSTKLDVNDSDQSVFVTTNPLPSLGMSVSATKKGVISIGDGRFTLGGFFGLIGAFNGSGSGTEVAINSSLGFAGNLIDAQNAGTSEFSVDASGNITSNTLNGGGCLDASSAGTIELATCPSGSLAIGSAIGSATPNLVLYADGSGNLAQSPNFSFTNSSSSPTSGLLNIGDGPFDGSSGGYFNGSATGTEFAVNAVSGFAGNLIDLQTNGTSKLSVDASGNITDSVLAGGGCLAANTAGTIELTSCGAASLAIGSLITGGSPNQVLFANGSEEVAQDANFTYIGGDLGLGTSAPDSTLTVNGQVHVVGANQLEFDTSAANTYFGNFTNPSGNLVGFSVPSNVLFAFDTSSLRTGFGGTGTYFASNNPNALAEFRGKADEVQLNVEGYSGQTNDILDVKKSDGTTLFNVQNIGNVGIGTASPASLFAVSGAPVASANVGLVSIGNGGFTGGGSNFAGSATGTQIALNATSTFSGDLLNLEVGGGSKAKIDASGNLYLSSLTAGGCLSAATSGEIQIATCGTTSIGSAISGATPNEVLFTDGSGNLAQSPNLYWDNVVGFLGIGTNSPTAAVDIRGTPTYTESLAPGSATGLTVNPAATYTGATGTYTVTIGRVEVTGGISSPIVTQYHYYTDTASTTSDGHCLYESTGLGGGSVSMGWFDYQTSGWELTPGTTIYDHGTTSCTGAVVASATLPSSWSYFVDMDTYTSTVAGGGYGYLSSMLSYNNIDYLYGGTSGVSIKFNTVNQHLGGTTWVINVNSAGVPRTNFQVENASSTALFTIDSNGGLGINTATSFTGNFANFQLGGTSKFKVDATGSINAAGGNFAFNQNGSNPTFNVGDIAGAGNGTKINLTDSSRTIVLSGIKGTDTATSPSITYVPAAGFTGINDLTATGTFTGTDTSAKFVITIAKNQGKFNVTGFTGTSTLGDLVVFTSGTLNGASGIVTGSTTVVAFNGMNISNLLLPNAGSITPSAEAGNFTEYVGTSTTVNGTGTVSGTGTVFGQSFNWTNSATSGTNVPLFGSGTPQLLANGVSIIFASPYRYTYGDQWIVNYSSSGSMLSLDGLAHKFKLGDADNLYGGAALVVNSTSTTLSNSNFTISGSGTSAAYGALSVGSGPFDLYTTNAFSGSASGTQLAINAASTFGGNLADFQVGGVSKFSVDSLGNLSIGGSFYNKGITWTNRTLPVSGVGYNQVAYGNGMFVAVGPNTATSSVLTSTDGVNWIARSTPAASGYRIVTYGNGEFVAIAAYGATSTTVITSPDGINWTARAGTASLNWTGVTYGKGLFVAVAQDGASSTDVMTSPDGVTWTSRTSAGFMTGSTPHLWQGVTYGNGTFVAVSGDSSGTAAGEVMTSTDGVTWTSRTAAAAGRYYSVGYGNGLFVAAPGAGSAIMTSPDGVTWTTRTSAATGNQYLGITYGNGLFVMTPTTTGIPILTSPDGITWTARTSTNTARQWTGVAYGNGVFAMTAGDNSAIQTSGTNDTAAVQNNNIYQGGFTAYGTTNLVTTAISVSTSTALVNIGDGSFAGTASSFLGSATGTELAINATSTFGGNLIDLQVGGSSKFKVDASGNITASKNITAGGGNFAFNANGNNPTFNVGDVAALGNRTKFTLNDSTSQVIVQSSAFSVVSNAASPSNFLNISTATSGSVTIGDAGHLHNYGVFGIYGTATSGDWSATLTDNNGGPYFKVDPYNGSYLLGSYGSGSSFANNTAIALNDSLSYDPTYDVGAQSVAITENGSFTIRNASAQKLLALDSLGNLSLAGSLFTKGISWKSATPSASIIWDGVAYGNGLFVAVANTATTNSIMTSPDGTNWTSRTSPISTGLNAITYGHGLFVAVSSSGNDVITSPDGVNWTLRTSPVGQWVAVTYGNGTFDASGSNSVNMTSPDGVNWTSHPALSTTDWKDITYGNGKFVAVASGGSATIATSPNGVTWTSATSSVANLYGVTYGNGMYVAVSNTATTSANIVTSPDAVTWTARTSVPSAQWYKVTYGNGLFIAVANTSGVNTIMTSPDGINWTSRTAPTTNGLSGITYGNGTFVGVGGSLVFTSGSPEIETVQNNNIYQGGITVYGTSNFLSPAVATSTYGTLNIGSGGFAGLTNNFVGTATGTQVAINAALTFAGNLLDLQVGGSSKLKLDASGNLNLASLTQNSVPYIGASGLVTQDNSNFFYNPTSQEFAVGFGGVNYLDLNATADTANIGSTSGGAYINLDGPSQSVGINTTSTSTATLAVKSNYNASGITLITTGGTSTTFFIDPTSVYTGTTSGNQTILMRDVLLTDAGSGINAIPTGHIVSDTSTGTADCGYVYNNYGGGLSVFYTTSGWHFVPGGNLYDRGTTAACGGSSVGSYTLSSTASNFSDIYTSSGILGNFATGVTLSTSYAALNASSSTAMGIRIKFDSSRLHSLTSWVIHVTPATNPNILALQTNNNNTVFNVDAIGTVKTYDATGAYRSLSLDPTNHVYSIGDIDSLTSGAYLSISAGSSGATSGIVSIYNANLQVHGTSGSTCTIGNGTSGTTCTSDARLKDNIQDLPSALAQINELRPVTFNWKDPEYSGPTNIGFIAQDMQKVYPQFVSVVDPANGYIGIDYAALVTPIVKSIQEMDLKLEPLTSLDPTQDNSLASLIKKYLADALNGVEEIFAKKIQTNELCLQDTCVTQVQLQQLLNQANVQSAIIGPVLTLPTSTSTDTGTSTDAGGSTTSTSTDDTASSTTDGSVSSASSTDSSDSSGTTASSTTSTPPSLDINTNMNPPAATTTSDGSTASSSGTTTEGSDSSTTPPADSTATTTTP